MALPSCSDTWLSDNSVSWGITWPKLATSSTALLLLRPSTDVELKEGARVEREHKVKDTAECPVAFHGHFLALSASSVQLSVHEALGAGEIWMRSSAPRVSRLRKRSSCGFLHRCRAGSRPGCCLFSIQGCSPGAVPLLSR